MKRGTLILFVVIGAILLIGFSIFSRATGTYDRAVALQEQVNNSWGDVQSSYQRRADLIPNLVATVQGAAENEKEILVQVTQARAGITEATTPEEMELMGRKINTAINLAFERYPQIRSTQNFSELQSQLEGTENRINVARDRYNDAVANYNTFIRGFWKRFYLGILGGPDEFPRKDSFSAKPGSEDAPEVSFE